MNWNWSYRSWQFLSQQLRLSLKISFWESSFVEICSKINPQVSLLVSLIRLIWMNRKLMNRKSMNRKLSYRNWKRKLSWKNLKFGNFRRPILFSVSFDLFAVPTFWFFHFVREQHFLLHPILLLQLVLKLPNVFSMLFECLEVWNLDYFLKNFSLVSKIIMLFRKSKVHFWLHQKIYPLWLILKHTFWCYSN